MPHVESQGDAGEVKFSSKFTLTPSLSKSHPGDSAMLLQRLGGMFRSKKKKLSISSDDPTYTVLYLGNSTTIQAKGEGCTDVAVSKIWNKSELGRKGTKMRLTVGAQGIRMVHMEEGKAKKPGHLYLLHRVTYCVADPRLPRIFAWIYRHEIKHKAVMLRCHAVLVSKPEKAKAMALLLYQTSTAALAEFQRLKRRQDARHQQQQRHQVQQQQQQQQQQVQVGMPMRMIINYSCPYKPPAERSRSAPRLGSITEDALGEEVEERAMLYDRYLDGDGDGEGLEDGLEDDKERLCCFIISELGELCIGNDVKSLSADLDVTRFLSGESTGSESSIDSGENESDDGTDDKRSETDSL